MNHTAHILASVFLCGLWLPIWAIIAAAYDEPWRCSICGFSDQVKYLRDPYLRQREATENANRPQVATRTQADEPPKQYTRGAKLAQGVGIAAVVLIGIAGVGSFFLPSLSTEQKFPIAETAPTLSETGKRQKAALSIQEQKRPRMNDLIVTADGFDGKTITYRSKMIDQKFVDSVVGVKSSERDHLKLQGFEKADFFNGKRWWEIRL